MSADARSFILTGPPAAGKSTLGRALAERLGRHFLDLDEAVTSEAGRSVAEIFAAEGEAGFRARERRALSAALSGPARVIAAGGGALLDRPLRHRVLKEARVFSLDAPLPALLSRAAGSDARPLLSGDLAARLSALLE